MQQPILIIGGGLSGLSLARSLKVKHISAIVFESAPITKRQGYGITLRSWAYTPLLAQLGATASKFKTATATDAPVGGHGAISAALVDATMGDALPAPPARDGDAEHDFFRVNRHRLREFLREGVDVRFEHKLVAVEKAPREPDVVIARFENGESVKGRMVVGADGVFSTVRSLLLPSIKPTVFPAVVINGQQRLPRTEFDAQIAPHMRETNVTIGLADNITLGISINDMTHEHVDLSWTYSRLAHTERVDPLHLPSRAIEDAREIPPAFFDELAALQALNDGKGLASPYAWVYDPVRAQADNNKLFHWLMRSVRVPRAQIDGVAGELPVAFIGDAVHAMPIFAGEGGNHSLLDGVQLARCVEKSLDSGGTIGGVVKAFYDGAYERWQEGVERSEKRLEGLHRPLDVWRKIAKRG